MQHGNVNLSEMHSHKLQIMEKKNPVVCDMFPEKINIVYLYISIFKMSCV